MKYRYLFLIMLINFIIQSTILQNFRVFGVVPNTALILVVIITVLYGTAEGLKTAATAGIMQDMFLSPALGMNLFIYMSLAFLIGMAEDGLFKDNVLTPIILISISTLYYHILHFGVMYFLRQGSDFMYILKNVYVLETMLNVAICLLVYRRIFSRVYGYELR